MAVTAPKKQQDKKFRSLLRSWSLCNWGYKTNGSTMMKMFNKKSLKYVNMRASPCPSGFRLRILPSIYHGKKAWTIEKETLIDNERRWVQLCKILCTIVIVSITIRLFGGRLG